MICRNCGDEIKTNGHLCGNPGNRIWVEGQASWEEWQARKMGSMAGTFASPPEDALRWRERAERAEAEVQRLRVQLANREAQIHELARSTEKAFRMSVSANSIPRDRLMALIRLCHPDLHGSSELANETTKWLLSLRK